MSLGNSFLQPSRTQDSPCTGVMNELSSIGRVYFDRRRSGGMQWKPLGIARAHIVAPTQVIAIGHVSLRRHEQANYPQQQVF